MTPEQRLGKLAHDWGCAPRREYAYVLGMYLGDGSISRGPRTYRLRITLDTAYPGIISEYRSAMQVLMPNNAVGIVKRRSNCVDVSCYSTVWPDILPQHGAGKLYQYDRYFFTNNSEDIKRLFEWACSLVGVETRRASAKNVSVAKRDSVARLNGFLGAKR